MSLSISRSKAIAFNWVATVSVIVFDYIMVVVVLERNGDRPHSISEGTYAWRVDDSAPLPVELQP
ncbi:hypothetical protein [Nostoc sphaeroides]|uniref:Uncharacterized protein n=1 Tax=Nostoc sphaeroides CCNUC1 TaxID=2653204 RepID=A0A5P8WE32_9NOSO|nr:hypothetical protein [Nostoc sphaeroides]QFS50426.1 hypothetical protein GXM_07920 [Nostoc sphaeroides CCNUC1]